MFILINPVAIDYRKNYFYFKLKLTFFHYQSLIQSKLFHIIINKNSLNNYNSLEL